MKRQLFSALGKVFKILTGKDLLYVQKNEHNGLGKTAAWSDLGFWYAGNVYDEADIAYGIAQNGIVEKEDARFVDRTLSRLQSETPDLVFYDIGANTGFYSMLASVIHHATVYAFEPVYEHTACLARSNFLNRVEGHVHVHTLALGASERKQVLALAGSGSTLNPRFLGTDAIPHREVPVMPLDILAERNNFRMPHFIKMDVEGYEWEVLTGAKKVIRSAQPICFIEIAKTLRARNFIHPHFTDITSFFEDLEYRTFLHQDGKFIPLSEATIPDGTQMYLFAPLTYEPE